MEERKRPATVNGSAAGKREPVTTGIEILRSILDEGNTIWLLRD